MHLRANLIPILGRVEVTAKDKAGGASKYI
jgi:hypothetical protein